MIEEATVDAYGESEQVGGFFTMIDERLAVPFETTLLGLPVTVKGVDLTERDEIVAICTRGRLRQPVPILDLLLPSPSPDGAEWIEAYRVGSADSNETGAARMRAVPEGCQVCGNRSDGIAVTKAGRFGSLATRRRR